MSNIVLLLAAGQGFLLTLLILHKHRRLFANRFLASVTFLFSLVLIHMLLTDLNFYDYIPQIMLVPLGLAFLIAPLHFLYARNLVTSGSRLKKSDWLHLMPFIIFELSLIPEFFKSGHQLIAEAKSVENLVMSTRYIIYNWVIIIQGLVYMFLTIFIIQTYLKQINNVFSSTEHIRLNWLRNITFMVIVLLILFMIEYIFFLFGTKWFKAFDITSVVTAVFIYILGYLGLIKSEIFARPDIVSSMQQLSELKGWENRRKQSEDENLSTKYKKSGLTDEKAKSYMNKLIEIMVDSKAYKDSNLTLNKLAEMTSISAHNLSEVFNIHLKQSFFDFVNQYRIKSVKQALKDPDKHNLTLLSIAMDSGFNSKSSFNAVFKKFTGQTPSQFRNTPSHN